MNIKEQDDNKMNYSGENLSKSKNKKEKVQLWLKDEIFLNKFTVQDYYREQARLLISKINHKGGNSDY